MRALARHSDLLRRGINGFARRSLWVLEIGALAGAYLVYYFVGVQMEILSVPHLMVFVPH